MSTLLELGVDLHAHMVEPKNGRCMPLRTISSRSPRWKAGGARKGTKAGSKFSSPHEKKCDVDKEAKTFRNKWNAVAKAQRRHLNSLTKAFLSNVTSHEDGEAGKCECPPRVVNSLTLEDYLCLQDDLQALSIQEKGYDTLQYAADQQLLLNTCCSPTPQHISQGVDNSAI